MIAFNHLAIALYVIAGLPLSLGAPTEPALLYTRDLEERIPDFDFFGNLSMLMARQDYNQNYKTGGNVNYSPSSNGYSVKFSGAQDFVVGKGWTTGSTR
jgi:endo-1,4-beta-xylanase